MSPTFALAPYYGLKRGLGGLGLRGTQESGKGPDQEYRQVAEKGLGP